VTDCELVIPFSPGIAVIVAIRARGVRGTRLASTGTSTWYQA
jgi:hypothetical protein